MKKLFILYTMVLSCVMGFAQTVTLTFTGRDADNHFIPFNRVLVANVTQGWQETLYYPDTILVMGGTGIEENAITKSFALAQNNPNPFEVTTKATLTTSEAGEVTMEMLDMNGRMVASQKFAAIQAGVHQFVLTVAAPGTYILTARQNGKTSSIKRVNNGRGPMDRIEYAGVSGMKIGKSQQGTVSKGSIGNPFNLGDEMVYIGYVNINGTEYASQTIHENQLVSENFVLNFDVTALVVVQPCLGAPTVTDHEGHVYNTVQIGHQCWTKENLRTTTSPSTGTYLIPASGTDYTFTGKQARWYNDDPTTYAPMNYGLLYNWNAAVDTFNTAYGEMSVNTAVNNAVSVTHNGHRRGICPAGWHLPSDAEWTEMTDYVSSQSEYVCGGNTSYIAKALADSVGWNNSVGTCVVGNNQSTNNSTGFSAVPAGFCHGSSFNVAGNYAYFWSLSQYEGNPNYTYYRYLNYFYANVYRNANDKSIGYSVRCLRDVSGVVLPTVTTNAVSSITATFATCGGNVISDGGATVIFRGVCWSTSPNPTVNDNHTIDGSGTGSFTSSITGLTAGTSYYVRAYATNSVGTAYGEERSFTANFVDWSCPGTPTVTDHEGNVYNTVKIGNQCWTRENLRTTTSPSTGTYLIPSPGTSETYTGKQAHWYNNDPVTYAPMHYGLLYNWNAAADTFNTAYGETSVNTNSSNAVSVSFTGHRRGICPAGWHLPSDAEWTAMTNYVSSQSEYVCGGNTSYIAKALADSVGWNNNAGTCVVGNNLSANNATDFSAVPAGFCYGSSIYLAGNLAGFWSSSQNGGSPYYAYFRSLYYDNTDVGRGNDSKFGGYSVRCLRDN